MDKGWGTPPTLHDLQMDKGCPPNPSRLADGQGLGTPTLHDLRMDEGWGPPNPSRLANLKFCLDKHWGLQTIERLSIFHRGPGASPQIETSMTSPASQNVRLSKFYILLEQGFDSKGRKIHDRAFRPRTYPNANLKFRILIGQALGPPNRRMLEHISKSTGSPSTDRTMNHRVLRLRLYVPQRKP